ncbi:MAG TPA: hypothetical protein PKA42_00285 [Candidatus Paceibacterota bacterium]|nr:hypothetical protein [Candidatus Paceibacterota bacterium]HMO82583.1 hypothetical protein [Candidatus Paceibacterota bacterium]
MNKTYLPVVVAILLAFFLLVLADLVPFWMPMMGEMMALLLVVVLLIIWVGFVLQEVTHDEREVLLKMKSGRVAYLSGLGVLTLGLVVQGFSEAIDPWIAIALATMVISKLLTRLYLEER